MNDYKQRIDWAERELPKFAPRLKTVGLWFVVVFTSAAALAGWWLT